RPVGRLRSTADKKTEGAHLKSRQAQNGVKQSDASSDGRSTQRITSGRGRHGHHEQYSRESQGCQQLSKVDGLARQRRVQEQRQRAAHFFANQRSGGQGRG